MPKTRVAVGIVRNPTTIGCRNFYTNKVPTTPVFGFYDVIITCTFTTIKNIQKDGENWSQNPSQLLKSNSCVQKKLFEGGNVTRLGVNLSYFGISSHSIY